MFVQIGDPHYIIYNRLLDQNRKITRSKFFSTRNRTTELLHNDVAGYILVKNGVDLLTTSWNAAEKLGLSSWRLQSGSQRYLAKWLRKSEANTAGTSLPTSASEALCSNEMRRSLLSLVLLLQPLFRSFSFSSFRVRGGSERFLWRGIRPWRAFSMLYLPPQR